MKNIVSWHWDSCIHASRRHADLRVVINNIPVYFKGREDPCITVQPQRRDTCCSVNTAAQVSRIEQTSLLHVVSCSYMHRILPCLTRREKEREWIHGWCAAAVGRARSRSQLEDAWAVAVIEDASSGLVLHNLHAGPAAREEPSKSTNPMGSWHTGCMKTMHRWDARKWRTTATARRASFPALWLRLRSTMPVVVFFKSKKFAGKATNYQSGPACYYQWCCLSRSLDAS